MDNKYDIIFIGSGIGTLTMASVISQITNKKILILEKHFKAGGFTHTFKRKKYNWDVGIHYIGEMQEGSIARKVFDFITKEQVKWNKMPEPFEKFVYPDFTFDVRSGKDNYLESLSNMFPDEKKSLEKYFRDTKKAVEWFRLHLSMKAAKPFFQGFLDIISTFDAGSMLMTTKEYLDTNFRNKKLKALLISQWGDYGMPPSQSPFLIHALIVGHYLNGGYYPVGSSSVIAESIRKIVENKNGEILLYRNVEEIIIKNSKAVGVKVTNTKKKDSYEEYYAPVIVSDTGVYSTYLKLIPESYPIYFRERLKKFFVQNPPTSNVTLYIGFKSDPRELGFRGENHWIYNGYDHDQIFENRNNWIESGELSAAYLSFASLKDPEAKSDTAEIITFIDYEYFKEWEAQEWLNRDAEYSKLKEKISKILIEYVDKRYPGFAELIDFYELSTPLSNEFFTSHNRGMIYGLPCVPDRFRIEKSPWTSPVTPLQGLYITGADVISPGVTGAIAGGIITLTKVLNDLEIMKMSWDIFRQ